MRRPVNSDVHPLGGPIDGRDLQPPEYIVSVTGHTYVLLTTAIERFSEPRRRLEEHTLGHVGCPPSVL